MANRKKPDEATEVPETNTTPENKPEEPVTGPATEVPEEKGEEIKLTLSLPISMFEQSPGSMQRLKAAIGSKQTLLKKALGTDTLEVIIQDDRVTFPWFTLTSEGNPEEIDAFSKLVFALAKKAITQVRVDPVEKVPADLRLGMNYYLTHLEFKGSEYKSARAVLMRNFRTENTIIRKTDFVFVAPEVYQP